jgi:hypothetical protein
MKKLTPFLQKAVFLFERLSSKPELGGIHISNLGVQYVSISAGIFKTFSFRFPPGVIKDGRIDDIAQLTGVFNALHEAIAPDKPNQKLQAVVSIPGAIVYTQSFSIPNVGDDKLNDAAMLNLQMISPISPQTAYMSWQMLEDGADKIDLLGAFVESSVIDAFRSALIAANFRPVAFEFPSLSVARIVSRSADTKEKNLILLQVSSDGINLAIIRNNRLHFDYFRSWHSIQGEESQISREKFDQVIVDEVRKVVNFSLSKFKVKIDFALVVAPGFEDNVKNIIAKNFDFSVAPLIVDANNMSPSLYVALGAAMRENIGFGKNEPYINLNKETSEDLFFEEHLLGFIGLWRNAFALVFGFFFLVFAVTFGFLSAQQKLLDQNILSSRSQVNQTEYNLLMQKSTNFNEVVKALQNEKRNVSFWNNFIADFIALAQTRNITIQKISASSLTAPISVSASSPDNASVIAFKNQLTEDSKFINVAVPLLDVKDLSDGSVGFTLSFALSGIEASN